MGRSKDTPQPNRATVTSEALCWRGHITGILYKVTESVLYVRGQLVGTMQVTPSSLETTVIGHSEMQKRAVPSPLIAGEAPGEASIHVSHGRATVAVSHSFGEPAPTNDDDPHERSKCPSWRGPKNTLCVTIPVEAASPPEATKEEEKTLMAEEEGKCWGEVLGE